MSRKNTGNLRPIETEFNGVVFKSKTEAMFAFMFEKLNWKWTYEPEFWADCLWDSVLKKRGLPKPIRKLTPEQFRSASEEVTDAANGYWPDFFVDCKDGSNSFIEIKPNRPTKTYIRKLKTLCERVGFLGNMQILFGSPYTEELNLINIHPTLEEENISNLYGCRQLLKLARNHRFDLAA